MLLDQVMQQPEENIRVVPMTSGNTVNITRDPFYGFWEISFARGELPAVLKGKYTKLRLVKEALNTWADKNDYVFGDPPPKAPPVATKTVRKQVPAEG